MERGTTQSRKYEEYAYVLDFNPRGKSTTVRGREGIIITSIGEDRLTLLEVLGVTNSSFELGSISCSINSPFPRIFSSGYPS